MNIFRGIPELSAPSAPLPLAGINRYSRFLLWILLAAVAWTYGLCLHPVWFGHDNDDAVYVVTAKALANGQGYRTISLPLEPPQTKYPPLYPLLLSLIWRLYPQFPANL